MKSFGTLKHYFIDNRWYIIVGLFSIIIVDILQLTIPRIIKEVIDNLAGGFTEESTLVRFAVMIIAAGFLMFCFRLIWRYCILGTSRRIEKQLRDRLFSHIIRLPLSSLIKTKTGDVMARMTNDLDAVRMCTGIGLVSFVDMIFLGTASIAFMLYINPTLTLFSLAPMFFIIVITWRLSGQLHTRFSKVQAAFSALTEKVRETITGIWVIKAYVREQDNTEAFKRVSENYIHQNIKLVKIWGLLFPAIMFFSNLSIAVLIFWGGRLTVFNKITPGDFVAFASYLWILTWPMIALGWVVNLFQRGSASLVRINEVLSMEPEAIGPAVHNDPQTIKGDIEIRNLTFSYAYGSSPVLNNISLSIKAGQTVGITGKIGSGKTTFCNLLLRLYKPAPGTIFIDKTDICSFGLTDLRRHIAYVPQDSFLFSDTIKENISFGKPEAAQKDLWYCADAAQLQGDITNLNDGLATILGERGVTLSGGQKQRMCIARALLQDAPMLILDDAMSSLDTATTQKIVASLKESKTKRTSIIVANRIASIKHADTIFVFSDSVVVESGTHAELMQKGGFYYNLYLKQQLENETV